MNSVRAMRLSVKSQMFTPLDCKDIGIRKFIIKYKLIQMWRKIIDDYRL